jgi:hypothetical protein
LFDYDSWSRARNDPARARDKEYGMYIDPNTGGMLFQVLAGFFGLISGAILLFSGQIRMWIARWRRSRRDEFEPEQPEE